MKNQRNVYILTIGSAVLYFATAKKVHNYCIETNMPVMKAFAQFKKWLMQDSRYEIGKIGIITYSVLI